jgi:hypothetical protein
MEIIALVIFMIVSLHLEGKQIISLYLAVVPNSNPYPMQEISRI